MNVSDEAATEELESAKSNEEWEDRVILLIHDEIEPFHIGQLY